MNKLIAFAFFLAIGAAHPLSAAELFWNDNAGIHRRSSDSSGGGVLLYQTFETRGLAIHSPANRLWWSDIDSSGASDTAGLIRSGSASGGSAQDLVSGLPSPAGVAVDYRHGKIYWTDRGGGQNSSAVYSANLDGTDAKKIISQIWLSEIYGIAVDPRHDALYFTYVNPLLDSLNNGGIARANLDGSDAVSILGGLVKPLGIAVDPYGQGVYWADAAYEGQDDGRIQASTMSGEGVRTILGGLGQPTGVALDLRQQTVYWTDADTGKIQRTGMSGILPYFQDVVTGLDNPTALAIASAAFVPGDATTDGVVDRMDLAVVADHLGTGSSAANWSMGDFDGDQRVTVHDLAILQAHFGGSTTQDSLMVAVPEPSGFVLAMLCGIGLWMRRRRLRTADGHG